MQRRFFIAATIALLAAGCSFLLDTAEATQCSTNADCEANPSLRNRVCQSGFCAIPGVKPGFETPDSGAGCVSTDLCTQDNSDQISVCRGQGGTCQLWQTPECKYFSSREIAKDPNAIIIGSILPLTVRQFDGTTLRIDDADRVRRAIDLAASEFDAELPGGILLADGKKHRIAVLHCDSGLTTNGAKLALAHLTGIVGAPALIVGADQDMFAIADEPKAKTTAIACASCIGGLPQGPLTWRISPRLELEAPMVNWRVSKLEEQILSLPSPPAQIKVALLTNDSRPTHDFVVKLRDVLRFNGGKDITQNTANFRQFIAEDPRDQVVDFQKRVNDIIAFEPDVVVVAMGLDFTSFYLPGIEKGWKGARRPSYITTQLNYTLAFSDPVGMDDDLRKRISGTRPGFTPELQANVDAFDSRYRPLNDFKDPDGNYAGYDAFYTLGMAILAASTQPIIDGIHISAGVERLRSGTLIDFRPQDIKAAQISLGQTAATVDVRGLWSTLDWNLATHSFDSDVSMYCLKRDATGSIILAPNAGPHLSTATGLVDGVYSCD